MLRNEATHFTHKLLDDNGLSDWHIRLVNDLTRPFLGKCVYADKTIFLNAHHIDIHPDEEVVNTIRHEVAHALCPGSGHNEEWAAKAKQLGCDNTNSCAAYSLDARAIDAIRSGNTLEVTFDEQVIRITKLIEKCPTCGKTAEEVSSIIIKDKKIVFLKCMHIITRIVESASPFESIVFDGDKDCKHEWNDTTICTKCNAKKLYPFQVAGAQYLEKSNGRAGIFDEMGLGKTIQANAWIKFHPEATPVLFIVKSGIKYQWSKEISRICGMSHIAQVIATSNDALIPGLRAYIISYDMLVSKSRTIKKPGKPDKIVTSGFDIAKFAAIGIKTVVLDECQQIKNPDSTRTQMVRRIVRDIPHIIPLSGTPWKNRGSEFFPVLNMLDPVRFNSYEGFLRRWVEYYYDGAHQKMGGIASPQKFKEYTKDILIRRERSEVMKELPTIQRNAYYCEMDDATHKAYETEENDFIKFWNTAVIGGDEDSFESAQGILARLTKMRHITGLAKIPNTVEFAKEFLEETDRKLVIFAHHIDVQQILFDQLVNHCASEHIAQPLKLTGGMTSEARYEVQEKFNHNGTRVMIASTLAAGEGLNLQTCSDCILHERQWSPANEEQAEGRFIRIGQQANAVLATYMIAQNSIDDHFHNLVERKRVQFHNAMNNGQMAVWNQSSLIKDLGQAIVDSAKKRR